MAQTRLLAHRGVVSVAYHQFSIEMDSIPPTSRVEKTNGLIEPCDPFGAMVLTGIAMGVVDVSVEVYESQPPLILESWDEAVEISLESQSIFDPAAEEYSAGELRVNVLGTFVDPGDNCGSFPALNPRGPGHYRFRVHANERGHDWDGQSEIGAEPVEQYLIQVWPAPPAPLVRHKRPNHPYWAVEGE